jgi:hypothetical protein
MAIKSTIDLDKLAQWDENGKWLTIAGKQVDILTI